MEQVAALVAARTGWPIVHAREPAAGEPARVYLGWEGVGGRGSQGGVVRVLLWAPPTVRAQRLMSELQVDEVQAAGLAARDQWQADELARSQGWSSSDDPRRYHLVLNTAVLSAEQAAAVVVMAARAPEGPPAAGRRRRRRGRGRAVASRARLAPDDVADVAIAVPAGGEPGGRSGAGDANGAAARDGVAQALALLPQLAPARPGVPAPIHRPRPPGERPAFAHPSEEEFARVLDFYRVQWLYEPTTFPLEWDEKGEVTLAFTPDFYIPAWKLYVELTTMKQSLVTRKNRKVRRLKELYPDVQIKVFYGRDFQRLLRKYAAAQGSNPPGSEAEPAPATAQLSPPALPAPPAPPALPAEPTPQPPDGHAGGDVGAAQSEAAAARPAPGPRRRRRPVRRRRPSSARAAETAGAAEPAPASLSGEQA